MACRRVNLSPLGQEIADDIEAEMLAQKVARSAQVCSKSSNAAGKAERERPGLLASCRAMAALTFNDATSSGRKARVYGYIWLLATLVGPFLAAAFFTTELALGRSAFMQDSEAFYSLELRYLLVSLLFAVQKGVASYAWFQIRQHFTWRLTFGLADSLYSANTYYRLMTAGSGQESKTPEQLISEEVFMVAEQLAEAINQWSKEAPGLIVDAYLLYTYRASFCIVSILMIPLSAPLVSRVSKLDMPIAEKILACNSQLTYVMARIQNNAEQIALFQGGNCELRLWERRFERWWKLCLRRELLKPLMLLSSGMVLGVFLLMGYVLVGDVLKGYIVVPEARTHFWTMFNLYVKALALVGTMGPLVLSESRAAQILSLIRAADTSRAAEEDREKATIAGKANENGFVELVEQDAHDVALPELELRDVTLWMPNQPEGTRKVLLGGVSFRLQACESLLIAGGTGTGKSALLLSIHGLWQAGSGVVRRCRSEEVFCVPQRPYMFQASLRDNLVYPALSRSGSVSDKDLWEALEAVNLRPALGRCSLDEVRPWHLVLSLGQQQRFAVARGLLRPSVRLLLLDEATSALDLENERRIYDLLRERFPCYVSVAHRPSVRKYHTHACLLEPNTKLGPGDVPAALATVKPMADFDFGDAQKKGPIAEVVVATQTKGAAAADVGQSSPVEVDFSELPSSFKQASMDRPLGGATLLWRALKDVAWPLLSDRDFFVPISIAVVLMLASAFASVTCSGMVYAQQGVLIDRLVENDEEKAWQEFHILLWKLPVFILSCLAESLMRPMTFALLMRGVRHGLARRYVGGSENMYYHLHTTRVLSNPSGRITGFDTLVAVTWLGQTLMQTLLLVMLIRVLGQVSHTREAPLLITYMIIVFTTLFIAFRHLMKYFSNWMQELSVLQADIIHTRENAEAVAMLQGGLAERTRAWETLDRSLRPGSEFLFQKYASTYFSDLLWNYGWDICWQGVFGRAMLVAGAPLGELQTVKELLLQAKEQAKGIFNCLVCQVEGQLGMERIWELMVTMNDLSRPGAASGKAGAEIELREVDSSSEGPKKLLELCSVTLRTPLQAAGVPPRTLLMGVSLKLDPGESLLIAGESGIGKSSLVRAVAGLWRNGAGEIRRPSGLHTFFIAQRPYMCIGSLREQLLYPEAEEPDQNRDEALRAALREVGLEQLLQSPGLDAAQDDDSAPEDLNWWSRLSLGEMQRLSFARLLLRREARLVLLDEATSGLSVQGEDDMYGLVARHAASYVSVAHRPQLRSFHSQVLLLTAGGCNSQGDEGPATSRMISMADHERELQMLSSEE